MKHIGNPIKATIKAFPAVGKATGRKRTLSLKNALHSQTSLTPPFLSFLSVFFPIPVYKEKASATV
jgi:hypothetical protein